jgi:cytochrome P450
MSKDIGASIKNMQEDLKHMVHRNAPEQMKGSCPFDTIRTTIAKVAATPVSPPASMMEVIPFVDLRQAQGSSAEEHPLLSKISHEQVTLLHQEHGQTFCTNVGDEATYRVFSADPQVASFVLKQNKFFGPVRCPDTAFTALDGRPEIAIRSPFDIVQPMAKGTVFDLTGQAWKDRRAAIQMVFLPDENMIEEFVTSASEILDEIPDLGKVDSQILSYKVFVKGTLNLLFGKQCELTPELWKKLEDAVKYFQVRYDGANGDSNVEPLDIAIYTSHIHEVCGEAVKWAEENVDKCTPGCAFLRMREKGFADTHELTSMASNFVVAAAESPASGMAHMLDMVAQDEEVQQKLKEEVSTAIERHPKMGKEFVKELVFCEAVLNEAMRLKAPATMVTREAVQDVAIPMSNGKTVDVKKGVKVNLCIHALHLNPEVWEDVNTFKPDRWMKNGKLAKAGGGAFLPFSSGQRGCPGKAISMMWMKTMMALIQKKEFNLGPVANKAPDADHCVKFVSWMPKGLEILMSRAVRAA